MAAKRLTIIVIIVVVIVVLIFIVVVIVVFVLVLIVARPLLDVYKRQAIYNTSFMHCWGALAMRAVHSPPLQPLFTRRGQLISPIAI